MKHSQEKKVHELRLAVKRLRALARLLGPLGIEEAKRINLELRAVGKSLSPNRDRTVRDKWLRKHGFEPPPAPAKAPGSAPPLKPATRKIALLRDQLIGRLPELSPAGIGFALRAQAEKVEKKRKKAKKNPCEESFHQWRKRAKELLYQQEILGMTEPKKLLKLTKILGRAQDSAVVQHSTLPPALSGAAKAAKKEKKKLWKQARRLGPDSLPSIHFP